ncbi:cytochrome C [Geobacter pickeringii]|nr:cytochrome C [Geobacter pickeringii]
MGKAAVLVSCIILLAQGSAFAHEGETHGTKHHDAQMVKLHKMMPMYAQLQAKINGALGRGDAATVEIEAGKILATIPDLKKAKPHKNLKKIGTFRNMADAFGLGVTTSATLAKRGDIAGAAAAFRKAEEKCNECHATFRD